MHITAHFLDGRLKGTTQALSGMLPSTLVFEMLIDEAAGSPLTYHKRHESHSPGVMNGFYSIEPDNRRENGSVIKST